MQRRRAQLGYETRAAMARATGRPKRERTITDLEKGYRDTFQLDTLEWFTEIYQVTFASLEAFLAGKAEELEPAAPPAPPAAHGALPPMTDPARRAAAIPYHDAIRDAIDDWQHAHPGTLPEDVPGAALFDDPWYVRTWEDPKLRAAFTITQLIWLLADIRRADAEHADRNGSVPAGA